MADILPEAAKPGRYDVLDGMRGIAALCVMIYHLSQLARTRLIFGSASLAVDFFFILSGFVIAHSYGKRLREGGSVSEYLSKRYIRLYPMFAAGILLGGSTLFLFRRAGLAEGSSGEILGGLAYNLAFLPYINVLWIRGVTKGAIFPANPPAWSLFFEVIASYAFILLSKANVRRLVQIVAASFAATVLSSLVLTLAKNGFFDMAMGWGLENIWGGFPRVLFGFTLGVLIHSFVSDKTPRRAGSSNAFGGLSVLPKASAFFAKAHSLARGWPGGSYTLYIALMLVFLFNWPKNGPYSLFILLIVAPCLVYLAARTRCKNEIEAKVARFLGWISYPVYCLHYPIGRAVYLASGQREAGALLIPIAVAATLILAMAFAKYFDEPLRDWLSQKLETRRERQVADADG